MENSLYAILIVVRFISVFLLVAYGIDVLKYVLHANITASPQKVFLSALATACLVLTYL